MNSKHTLPEREEITAILERQKEDRGRNKLYPEVNREIKTEAISADVSRKTAALMENMAKVDLSDFEAVKARTEVYLRGCSDSGTFPSVMGLSALGFGCSRQWVNEFCRTHKGHKTAEFIERLKDVFADVLANAALNRVAAETMSIFILKNTAGFVDKVEITPGMPESPLGDEPDRKTLEAKFCDIVIED